MSFRPLPSRPAPDTWTTLKVARLGTVLATALLGGAAAVQAEEAGAEDMIVRHGFSIYDEFVYEPGFAHLAYVNPEAPKGGEIAIWWQGTFDSMNPYATAEGNPGYLSSIFYETILSGTADDPVADYCLLCERVEYPPSEDWVIFHLRPEARFSDGTPLTAHDVVFTYNLLIEQATPSYRQAVGPRIQSVEALDDHAVKFTFAEGIPRQGLISQVGALIVFPRAWFEETGARLDESRLEVPPGSGPYVLESYDIGRRIVYSRNPDYWGEDLPINVGRNNFDRIRVEYFADSTAAFEAFKAGEYTFRSENSSLTWATGYEFPALSNGWVIREEIEHGLVPSATGFVFNLRREKFQDLRVRQALALMYNFTWTNETLQYGLFRQRESFWQGSDLAATGLPEGRELELLQQLGDLVDPAILTEEVTMPHVSGESQVDRGNLRRALALMEEAGWTVGGDGLLRNAAGATFDLEFLSDSPSFDRILTPYVDNLRRLGVNASYNRVDPAQYTNRERSFDWDMIYGGYTSGLIEGSGLAQRYGSRGVGDVFNPAGYSSEAVDQLAEIVAAAETYDEMTAAVRAVDRIMRRELFVIPAWYNDSFWVAYYDMFRRPEEMPPYALGQLDFWWFDAEAAERLRAAGALRR